MWQTCVSFSFVRCFRCPFDRCTNDINRVCVCLCVCIASFALLCTARLNAFPKQHTNRRSDSKLDFEFEMKIVNCRNEVYSASASPTKNGQVETKAHAANRRERSKWTSQRNNNCLCHISDCLLKKIRLAHFYFPICFSCLSQPIEIEVVAGGGSPVARVEMKEFVSQLLFCGWNESVSEFLHTHSLAKSYLWLNWTKNFWTVVTYRSCLPSTDEQNAGEKVEKFRFLTSTMLGECLVCDSFDWTKPLTDRWTDTAKTISWWIVCSVLAAEI